MDRKHSAEGFPELEEALEKYGGDRENLITVLQRAQELYGYLSPELMKAVSLRMDIPLARIMGVASFYAQFSLEPVGKYTVMLCQGTACHVNGSGRIMAAVSQELGVPDGHTTNDGLFTLKSVACLGCCSLSPVMMINGEAFGSLTPERAVEIIRGIRAREENR